MDPSMMAGEAPQLKSADAVIKDLGLMYKECHAIDGSGQACQAIQQIMQAVSEVANNIGSMGQGSPSPQHQDPFMQAGQNVADQMSAASAQQGPPPGGGY